MHSPESLTRQDALIAWKNFLPSVPAYAQARNHVRDGHENVSRLSAGIRFRTLSEDEVIEDTLNQHKFEAAEKWLQEVCWRRYWKGWLEMRPQLWAQWRRRVRLLRQTLPSEVLERADAVSAAKSGVACMDRIASELVDTGYLHNHARMWWASFWIHVELLPWELGADFFFRHLLDADPASNTLSWRWVAGLQTPGKSYLVRLSNIEKYAPDYLRANEAGSERLADGEVTARVMELSDVWDKEPLAKFPTSFAQKTERTGLWLHADDLLPEIGPLSGLAPASVAAYVSDSVCRREYHLGARRVESLQTVIRDGLARSAVYYGCPSVLLEAEDPVEGLVAWASDEELAEVVAFAPFVGPTRDILTRLIKGLESAGIRLTLIRRPSDETAFSFATAGFFPFWQKMSRHLMLGRQS
jgi:deoxyribodipyrimidine photo-lyase